MKRIYLSIISMAFLITSCSKSDNSSTVDFATQEKNVINDFVNKTALPQYNTLAAQADTLNKKIDALQASPTDANLIASRLAWKSMRNTWEQCEGFLFGPVEDNNYDPNTDTWPTDYVQMDSLLVSNNSLDVSGFDALPQSLRGYHPLEYVIFGKGGSRTTAELTPRLLTYAVNLSADIFSSNAQALYQSWATAPTNYANEILTAGNGSTKFPKRQDVFLAMVGSMGDICNEVGTEKMYEPFIAKDSSITESPYSDYTATDFKNNIIGLQNVYLGINGGKGLKDLVALKDKNLDNKIQSQITAAINSFSNITLSYEKAIFDQRVQVQNTMDQLSALKDLLSNDLYNFIVTNVQD